jgi:two-component sensor histidine kinase/HAMP domain-containing protein
MPESEAFFATHATSIGLPLTLFALILVATLVMRSMLESIFLKSVEELREGARRLAQGDLAYRMEVPRLDELGKVMVVFNDMARRIQEDRLTLENRVQARTQELTRLNEVLKQEIAEHGRAEQELRASLKEKEVLITEVHHRVKNNLQIISSLLNMQSRFVQDEHALEILRDSQSRVRSIALIHERLYQSESLANVEFGDYIKTLTTSLLQMYRHIGSGIQVVYDLEQVELPLETAVPCGLIMNELITNALKYAFPGNRQGSIWISVRGVGSMVEIRVADDGVGIPRTQELGSTKRLGLPLVTNLVNQLNGTLDIQRQRGSQFKIVIPRDV